MFDIINIYRWQIASALIMAAIGAYLVALNNRRNRFASTCDKFRNTVLKELEGLYPIPSNWPSNAFAIGNILEGKFHPLQTAVAGFRSHLPWYRRKSFDLAWFKYYNAYATDPASNKNKSEQCYHHYMDLNFSDTKSPKETFKQNVDDFLNFATYT